MRCVLKRLTECGVKQALVVRSERKLKEIYRAEAVL
jgi:hypothetical protein